MGSLFGLVCVSSGLYSTCRVVISMQLLHKHTWYHTSVNPREDIGTSVIETSVPTIPAIHIWVTILIIPTFSWPNILKYCKLQYHYSALNTVRCCSWNCGTLILEGAWSLPSTYRSSVEVSIFPKLLLLPIVSVTHKAMLTSKVYLPVGTSHFAIPEKWIRGKSKMPISSQLYHYW